MSNQGQGAAAKTKGGVIPISVTQSSGRDPKLGGSRSKTRITGVKVVIRYLPPAMTEDECVRMMSEEWRAGGGKVAWFRYEPGKPTTGYGKPSLPARAYLHLTEENHLGSLREHVRTATWEDTAESYNDPILKFPPFVEVSAFQRVPPSKERLDSKQGTIDQDPELIEFLETLTNPKTVDTKENVPPTEEAPKEVEKVTTTALLEYIKASKEKEAALAKSSKGSRQDAKAHKAKGEEPSKKSKAEKADRPRETVKILTKKAAAEAAAEAAKNAASQMATATPEAPKSRRAGLALAARLLQRDLGLSPAIAHRKARLDAAKGDTGAQASGSKESTSKSCQDKKSDGPSEPDDSTAATILSAPGQTSAPVGPKSQVGVRVRGRGARGSAALDNIKGKAVDRDGSAAAATPPSKPVASRPVVLLKKKNENTAPPQASPTAGSSSGTKIAAGKTDAAPSSKSAAKQAASGPSTPSAKKSSGGPATKASVTRAFVKHANLSQGITETVLKESLSQFGTVTFVEIDKRKGFAYVDFADHDGLVKAMAASPVPVAQGTVQVLERKDTKVPGPATGGASSSSTAGEKGAANRSRRGRRGGEKSAEKSASGGAEGHTSTPVTKSSGAPGAG